MHYNRHRKVSNVVQAALVDKILQNLVFIEYFQFPNFKKVLDEDRFGNNNEIIFKEKNTSFGNLDKSYYLEKIT